jgi:hypothetical protein
MKMSADIAPNPVEMVTSTGGLVYVVLALLAVGSFVALFVIRRKRK